MNRENSQVQLVRAAKRVTKLSKIQALDSEIEEQSCNLKAGLISAKSRRIRKERV